ncbi:MAG: hypothetical protein PHD37_03940 [Gallionellaceae bacterium]|nr:hypothetical protein [Gallionellaceae bacterium]
MGHTTREPRAISPGFRPETLAALPSASGGLHPGYALDNRRGYIASNSRNLSFTAASLDNSGGLIAGNGALNLSVGELLNQGGNVQAGDQAAFRHLIESVKIEPLQP